MMYLAILAGTIVFGGLVLTGLLASNMAPGRKRLEMETARMKADMDKWAGDLVPIDQKELELFSLGQDKQVIRKGIATTAKGIFTTIYHEPVLAYSYREYLSNNKEKPNGLLYARTAEHEYIYWIQKGNAVLFIDGQEVGTLDAKGELRGKKTGKTIAQITAKPSGLLPVVVGNKEVGNLTAQRPQKGKGLSERAFEYIATEINDKEEQLFLALTLQEMVKRGIEVNK
ncbi:MAG: hypothetical protein R2795_21020 [Saprospiraceae bacterium]